MVLIVYVFVTALAYSPVDNTFPKAMTTIIAPEPGSEQTGPRKQKENNAGEFLITGNVQQAGRIG